ncbi:MAG: hypothetical protein KatS3mg060_2313 [Dehalococcoidia bacterium]|nr:MAG: hypothetical protein KatS3mg060_2313 [Dehalococcoidia bacterium]
MKITRDYQVLGLPNTFLIDADGVIRDRVVGPLTLDQMRARGREGARRTPRSSAPRLVSVWAAMAAENDRPAGQVLGTIVTLGEVNRRVDLENALGVLRGGVAPDYSTDEGRTLLREQQRAMGERLNRRADRRGPGPDRWPGRCRTMKSRLTRAGSPTRPDSTLPAWSASWRRWAATSPCSAKPRGRHV